METGKTTRYFKYAIGEIILVVIGILIALQINNWNEERKADFEENNILVGLLGELKTAKITCQTELDNELQNLKSLEKLLGSAESKKAILKDVSVDSLFFRFLWAVGENPSVISAITEIQNSGNTSKIRNTSIRKQITTLDACLKTLETIVRDRLTVQQLSIDKFGFEIENFSKLIVGATQGKYDINYGPENDFESLIENQNFLNAIAIKLDLSDSVIDDRKALIKEIEKLIYLIENELNK